MIVVQDRTSLTLFNTRTGRRRGTIARQDWIDAWRLSPNEHYLVIADDSGMIAVLGAVTLRTMWSARIDQHSTSAAVDDIASASVAGDCRWTMFDRHGSIRHSISVDCVIAPDGQHIACSISKRTYAYRRN